MAHDCVSLCVYEYTQRLIHMSVPVYTDTTHRDSYRECTRGTHTDSHTQVYSNTQNLHAETHTGWRRRIGSLIFIGHCPQSDMNLVALLWKMICNLGDPMSLRHPIHTSVLVYTETTHSRVYTCESVYSCTHLYLYTHTETHTHE